jgi:hypothetical protein
MLAQAEKRKLDKKVGDSSDPDQHVTRLTNFRLFHYLTRPYNGSRKKISALGK